MQGVEIMTTLVIANDDIDLNGITLLDISSLAVTFDETGTHFNVLDFLVLSGATSVSIASNVATSGGSNALPQLAETDNALTTVTIKGAEKFVLGATGTSNVGDGVVTDIDAAPKSAKTIASSLELIDGHDTTGTLIIYAGASNTSGAGDFANGASLNANATITYTGLKIEGGKGNDVIENDANKGIVTDGNGIDTVILGGAGATATVGTGTDTVVVGVSGLGTTETAGSALGDNVTFGVAAKDVLIVGAGAEVGSNTTNIGATTVHDAAGGLQINFTSVTASGNAVDENAAAVGATTLTLAENAAVDAMAGKGVAYFAYKGSEYLVATNNTETAVSSSDAVVKLVGVTDLTVTGVEGVVTLHAP